MSQKASQHRAQKRKQKQAKRKAITTASHHKTHTNNAAETPHWEAVFEIHDLVRQAIATGADMTPYLNDPAIQAKMNPVDIIEGVASIKNDLDTHILPTLDKLTEDLRKFSGPVKENEVDDFMNAFRVITIISGQVQAVISSQINSLLLAINKAANEINKEQGTEGYYIPPSIRPEVEAELAKIRATQVDPGQVQPA